MEGAPWVPERVLERYELIYEVDLAIEACATAQNPRGSLAFRRKLGHRIWVSRWRWTIAGSLRQPWDGFEGKLKYRPVVFELLPSAFTLFQLQRVVEALAGVRLHKQNLRRLVEKGGLVEGTAQFDQQTGGRPAELFRFRRDVLRERPAPGVGLPGIRHAG